MELTVAQRVASGAAWLDEQKPGWERIVDLPKFKIEDGCRCVLGQVFEEEHQEHQEYLLPRHWASSAWSWVVLYHGLGKHDPEWSIDLGFDAIHLSYQQDYEALQEAWTQLIKNRFDTGALSDG